MRLSGERKRVRCSRGFGDSLLMSRDMAGRYAWAELLFNAERIGAKRRAEMEDQRSGSADLERVRLSDLLARGATTTKG